MNNNSLQNIENISHELISSEDFETIKVYIDESHMIRKLIKHNPSGELYFYEFNEKTDWVNGNDPQYRTYIPVETEQQADEINKLSILEIHEITPRLIDDYGEDNTRVTKWMK